MSESKNGILSSIPSLDSSARPIQGLPLTNLAGQVGNPSALASASALPRAHGTSQRRLYGVEEMEPDEILQSFLPRAASRVLDPGLVQSSQALQDSGEAFLDQVWNASKDSMDWSTSLMLPGDWLHLGAEMKVLWQERGLYHPVSPWLSEASSLEWWKIWLHELPTWLVARPSLRKDQPPIPILVQSPVRPAPGDNLGLAFAKSIWDAGNYTLSSWTAGEEPISDISIAVMWPAFRLIPADVELAVVGAVLDRAFFRVNVHDSLMKMS